MVYLLCEKYSYNCNNQMLLEIGCQWAYESWHHAERGTVLKSHSFSFPRLPTKGFFPLHSPPLRILGRDIPPPPSPMLAWSFHMYLVTRCPEQRNSEEWGTTYLQLHIDSQLSHHRPEVQRQIPQDFNEGWFTGSLFA